MAQFFSPIEPIKPMSFNGISPIAGGGEQGESEQGSSIPFADILKDAVSTYANVQGQSADNGQLLALGDVDDLAQIQITSMKAQAALSTTVQLTSRAVNAYKEIMQMQV